MHLRQIASLVLTLQPIDYSLPVWKDYFRYFVVDFVDIAKLAGFRKTQVFATDASNYCWSKSMASFAVAIVDSIAIIADMDLRML